jgi:hypothetical protein
MSNQFRSWTEGLDALRERAEEVRGVVEDGDVAWPKTTNGDAITIAAVIDPSLKARRLPAELAERWRVVRDDVMHAAIARSRSTYANNRELWSTVAAICDYLDEVPVPDLWGVLADHLGGAELRNAGPMEDGSLVRFEGIESFDKLWMAQKKYLEKKRGADRFDPPPGFPGVAYPIPRSTNADVLQLATYWTKTLADMRELMGYDGVKQRWEAALADVDKLAKTGKPDDVYPRNNEFWRTSWQVAVQAAVSKEAPTKWDLFVDMVKDTFTSLPSDIASGAKTVASGTVDVLEGGAHALGKVANAAGRGMFAGAGTPLVIGAGLVGLYFLTRSRDHENVEA